MTEHEGPPPGGEKPAAGSSDLPPAIDAAAARGWDDGGRRWGPLPVTLTRTATALTPDQALWSVIRYSTDALSFDHYAHFIEEVLCDHGCGASPAPPAPAPETPSIGRTGKSEIDRLAPLRAFTNPGIDAYRLLKVATEAFLITHCGVQLDSWSFLNDMGPARMDDERQRLGVGVGRLGLQELWDHYRVRVNGATTLPYLALIRAKLADSRLMPSPAVDSNTIECYGILQDKLTRPCFLELIWSYWCEQGMLVQTMNAISLRFQNKRRGAGRDPLAELEIDPLRPLNNLMWGYVQDTQHRLSVVRRAYEYNHQYGVTLAGKAVGAIRPADSRSKFLEAFHGLLALCVAFYERDDQTTVIADAFPVLNALKEVHLLLGEGGSNQFLDLGWTARQEMLMEQWLLARPEFGQFLPSRVMVSYTEPWMPRVDAMKTLQGWTNTNVTHFHNLAIFAEPVVLSVRFGDWSRTREPARAANWARYWRAEIQGYVHAYRTVTAST